MAMDKLNSMRVFVAVAQTNGFSAAAETLGLSKGMISKNIKQLEEALGVRLLNRTNRRVHLTEAGSIYLESCQRILSALHEADQTVAELQAESRGTLKLTSPTSFGTYHLLPAIEDYNLQYPEVKVKLHLNDNLVDLVETGQDLAIRIGKLEDTSLIARPLAAVRNMVCGAPSYFEEHGIPQAPEELIKHNCLIYNVKSPKGKWVFQDSAGEYYVNVTGDFEANLGDALRLAAIGGRGLIQLPSYVVGSDLDAGRLVAVLTQYESEDLPICVLYPHRRHLPATVRTFIDFLQSRFQPGSYWDK
jgi:DNA-binding transcriptional LysR family regulator